MSDSSISILILDTDQIFLLGLATALSKDSRYKIIDQAFKKLPDVTKYTQIYIVDLPIHKVLLIIELTFDRN